MTTFMVSQILVSIAIVFDLISFQFKNRKYILICFIISLILISLHFLLLEKYTAAILTAIGIFRFLTSYFTTSLKARNFFIVFSIFVSIFTFQGYLSIISCLATIFATFAAFHKRDEKLRELMIIGSLLWIVHNILALSPMAVIMEVLFLSSNLFAYYRFYIRKVKIKD